MTQCMQINKNPLRSLGDPRIENVTSQSNCISNVWNNLLKKVEGKEADLSNSGNDLSL